MNSNSMQLNIHDYYDHIPFEGSALSSIQETLTAQGEALLSLANNFNQLEFHKALSYMYQCKGHIIISGMGKSGLIGRKICATLASTGSPSFFVHPGEAFHGDLGMITKHDVIILISNSGETDEVLQLIPSLKSFANPIISICNNADSTMAKNSNAVLELKMDKETCPNNLAPTTSTTLTLAVGDALAVALMHKRGFAPNDFAKYHPGGSLGRRLLTRVEDEMISENLPFVFPETLMSDVVLTMTNTKVTGLAIVVDEKQKLIGVITDGDIRRLLAEGRNLIEFTAEHVMTKKPLTISKEHMLAGAEEYIRDQRVKQLVVTSGSGLVVGVLEHYSNSL
jgi:arabinose-5-phosphate isomerase